MALIATKSSARAANALTFAAAAAGGDTFANTGKEMVLVRHTNAVGSNVTLTIPTPQQIDADLAVADRTIVIAPGEEHLIGPFPKSTYNDAQGQVTLSFSDETDIELAVIEKGA